MAITKNNQGHWRIEGTVLYPKINVPYWFKKDAVNPNNPDKPGLSIAVDKTDKRGGYAVSYTHLTLPTILLV